jgi:hypothetical protein
MRQPSLRRESNELGTYLIAPPILSRCRSCKDSHEVVFEEDCAGTIEQGESDETAARREAYEELGVALHGLKRIACIWSSPGVRS